MIYLVLNNRNYDVKNHFSCKNIFNGKWFPWGNYSLAPNQTLPKCKLKMEMKTVRQSLLWFHHCWFNDCLANLSINPIPMERWHIAKIARTATWMCMGSIANQLWESMLRQITSYETIEIEEIVNLIPWRGMEFSKISYADYKL